MFRYDLVGDGKILAWCCTNKQWEVMTYQQFNKQPEQILPPFNSNVFGGNYTSEVPSMKRQMEIYEDIMKRPPCTC